MIELTQYNIIPLISFLLYTVILIIIYTSSRSKLSRSFIGYVVAMMVWSIGSFLMKTNVPPSSLFWNKILQLGFIMVPILLLRFSYILAGDYERKKIVVAGYFIALFVFYLTLSGNVVKDAWYINNEFGYELGWGAYFDAIVGLFYCVMALFVIIRKTMTGYISFKRIRLVLIGLVLVIVGGVLNISPQIGVYGIDILFNTINAFLITYSIYRNKFLEINLVAKKGISFSITNVLIYFVYSVLILYSADFVRNQLGVSETYQLVFILVPLFIFIGPTRTLIDNVVKSMLYKNTIDINSSLKEFSTLVQSSLDINEIVESLTSTVKTTIDCEKTYIFLKDQNVYIAKSVESGSEKTFRISPSHPIVKWFEQEDKDILLKTQIENHILFKGLWKIEKDLIESLQSEILVPIKYRDELIGIMSLAQRADDNPYSTEDTNFLKTIVNNAAAIIENAKTIEFIKRQSITDELTKFYNHRYFRDTVGTWIRESQYNSFAICMIDIDQFAIYNELYGHASGDEAIRRIASIIERVIDDSFMKVRFGGEEFVVVMTNQTEQQGLQWSEKIREAIESEFLLSSDIREFLTVSIGLSFFPPHGVTLNELVNNATKACLVAKKSGRNRVYIYHETIEQSKNDNEIQDKIERAFASSIYALAATIDAKDHYTYGHSKNVALMSQLLAQNADCTQDELDQIYNAGLLHDIGKVGIPESVLGKAEYLTEKEIEVMQGHVVQSINIIKHIPELINIVPIVISHHERYDGTGYPRGLSGENIPKLGRIIAIADSFDAMTTNRPYREGLTLEQAIYELKRNAGKQFDPEYSAIFIDLVESGELSRLELVNRSNLISR